MTMPRAKWCIIDGDTERVVRAGPYSPATAAAVRAELELQERYDHLNLCIVPVKKTP